MAELNAARLGMMHLQGDTKLGRNFDGMPRFSPKMLKSSGSLF